MATKWTETLIPTMREDPSDSDVPSQRLMVRAGLIRRLGAGLYSYLPAGWRALFKVETIIREQMDAAGAAELLLPTLHPIELWQRTGRDQAYGENLFTLTDRHGRKQALGPTHEEIVTDLVGSCISSYKDLPKTVYQIQTKFRDEYRPRFGVLRSREFQMKDAYSFHLRMEGEGGLDETYQKQFQAYCNIFERCGVPYRIVEAESGPIGGSASHEFMVPSPTGEDVILQSNKGNYAANVEKCAIGKRRYWDKENEPQEQLENVPTPGIATIEEVASFFKVGPDRILKTVVCRNLSNEDAVIPPRKWILAVVRGDHELNLGKLSSALGANIELAEQEEAREAGFCVGYVGPTAVVDRTDASLIIDPDATNGSSWIVGANRQGYHCRGFNWGRDLDAPRLKRLRKDRQKRREVGAPPHPEGLIESVADIRNAVDGDPAPEEKGGGTLRETKGIEVGHVFKLGDKYTKAMDVTVLDEHNQPVTPIMGCYGIGVNRILAAAIEREGGYDESGIIWPKAIAPYQVIITPIKYEGAVKETVDKLATEIEGAQTPRKAPASPSAGFEVDVLIDDRSERPGVKFNDADLLGIPLRITVGDKGLKDGIVEIKARDGSTGDKGERVAIDQAAQRVVELLKAL